MIRFDVAADRMFQGAVYVGSSGTLDICEAKGDYALSSQASIFRRKALLKFYVLKNALANRIERIIPSEWATLQCGRLVPVANELHDLSK